MYSENNRRTATRRADGEFLRRLSGGELGRAPMPREELSHSACRAHSQRPTCDGGAEAAHCHGDSFAPSLAMVYSPRQCWRNLLEPSAALSAGSLFSELILPLALHQNGKEVSLRRPM